MKKIKAYKIKDERPRKIQRRYIVLSIIFLIVIILTAAINSSYVGLCVNGLESYRTSAGSMVVVEVTTGRLLYSKNCTAKSYMASTTKILTAITVIENLDDLDILYKIPDEAVGVEGSSIYLEKGEKMSARDLLYGLMLRSGNDCAESLAIITAGSIENFACLMNATAKKAGANSSNFVNPHGLHDDNHYTTAYDLAIISAYALQNETFAEIVSTRKHTTPYNGKDYDRVMANKNKLLASFEGCDGVKTGYTKKAGRCLVSSATRDGMQVVAVVLNCAPMFEDCASLMQAAFDTYSMQCILETRKPYVNIEVEDSTKKNIACGVEKDVYYPLAKNEVENITFKGVTSQNVVAPIKIGENIGKLEIYLSNRLLFSEKLFTIESADSLSIVDRLFDIASRWSD